MSIFFSAEEQYLLVLLERALQKNNLPEEKEVLDVDILEVILKAKRHAVLSGLYDVLQQDLLTQEQQMLVERESRQIVLQNYRLLFLTKYLVELLEKNNIQVIVLKGVATANWYPVPELRKSGDVDLLIQKDVDVKELSKILISAGFSEKEEQHANYHIEFVSREGITVEIHTDLTEAFTYQRINTSMDKHAKECFRYIKRENVMGIDLPVLSKAFHAYELLLHMLHHFLTSGFGLKLLCDWVVCWKQEWPETEKKLFMQLTAESGTGRFAEVVTEACIKYFGMRRDEFAWSYSGKDILTDEFLREILDSDEFGGDDNNRMLMMNGTGFGTYVKEFHHQMHLNFPKIGKCIFLWPILWLITLIRFLRNNRKVRNTSARKVFKEVKRRSELMKRLKIFPQ